MLEARAEGNQTARIYAWPARFEKRSGRRVCGLDVSLGVRREESRRLSTQQTSFYTGAARATAATATADWSPPGSREQKLGCGLEGRHTVGWLGSRRARGLDASFGVRRKSPEDSRLSRLLFIPARPAPRRRLLPRIGAPEFSLPSRSSAANGRPHTVAWLASRRACGLDARLRALEGKVEEDSRLSRLLFIQARPAPRRRLLPRIGAPRVLIAEQKLGCGHCGHGRVAGVAKGLRHLTRGSALEGKSREDSRLSRPGGPRHFAWSSVAPAAGHRSLCRGSGRFL